MRCIDTIWRGFALGGHRRNDDCSQMIVHFWRRDDGTGTPFPNLTSDCWVEIDHPNVATRYHLRSASASLENSPSTSASSPAMASFFDASAHPDRTGLFGFRRTKASPSMVISASPSKPIWASSGFGITMPWELPICRMVVFMSFSVAVITVDVMGCWQAHVITSWQQTPVLQP